jgi:ketosteroid isomerase-like protein
MDTCAVPEEVDVVRRWLDALERGDPAPEMCDPEVEIVNWAESPIPGPYYGHDGVRQWWNDIADAFEGVRFHFMQIERIDAEWVVTAQRLVGTFRLTGIEIDAPWGSVISVRDGKILKAVGYSSPRAARRAVGLE